jgi:hypothetical protein
MKAFQFRGERVLDWYRKQAQLEEKRLSDCIASRHRAQKAIDDLRADRERVARELISHAEIRACELASLEPYRIYTRKMELDLIRDLEGWERAITAQRLKVHALQRRVRLLEKLRERRRAEHVYQMDRELEELASEAYLARWQANAQAQVNRQTAWKPPARRPE